MVTKANIPGGYKQTEIGVIPDDWEVGKIKNHAVITTGAKNTQDKQENGAYPFFVRSSNIERINSYSYDGEAVLTAGDGVGTGKIFHYIDGKFDFHQRVYKISEFGDSLCGHYFYLYFSNNFYDRIMSMTAKSSVDSVRMEMIADMPIPLPTKVEQQAIAEALSDVDGFIALLDELINKKRNIKQGAMQQLLTGKKRLPGFSGKWETKKLGDICGRITTGKLDANAMVENGEYRFYTCAKEFCHINTYAFEGKALLVSGNGANVGYVHYYDGKFNAYQRTYVLMGFSDNIMFLKRYMDKYLKCRIDTEVNAGNTPYIKMDTLTEMEVLVPNSPEEQQSIAQVLSNMDAEIDVLERKRDKYKMIKQGMMQELLTGKTRLV